MHNRYTYGSNHRTDCSAELAPAGLVGLGWIAERLFFHTPCPSFLGCRVPIDTWRMFKLLAMAKWVGEHL